MTEQNFTIEELQNETWKPVHEHYEVSNIGRVRYVNILDGSYKGSPYHRISFASGKHGRNPQTKMVHTLVAQAFLGERPEGMHINHKDGNKHNNRIENLEYVTPLENVLHARRLKTWTKPKNENWKGSAVNTAKITESDVKEIRHLYKNGESNKSLRQRYNLSKSQISKIVRHQTWRHVE